MSIDVTRDNQPQQNQSFKQSRWVSLSKEPLLHFIVIGVFIYLLFGFFNQSESDETIMDKNTIVITKGEINWLAEMWQKKWNRAPTKEELAALIQSHLRETVLYREALSMGLDKDDVIIRRRLAQKLEFVAQDLIQPEAPTEKELHSYFEKNINRYRTPDLITFTHVYLDPDKRGDQTLADARKLKAKFIADSRKPDAKSDLGDRFMLQSYYPERSEADISKLFGNEFAKSIIDLKPEQWHGPVLSGYGTHLVYIHDRQKNPLPTFEQVAEQVRTNLENQNREKLNDEYIAGLLRRYKVVIEDEELDADPTAAVGATSK